MKELKSIQLKSINGYEIWKNQLSEDDALDYGKKFYGKKAGEFIYDVCDEEDLIMSFATLKEAKAYAMSI